MQWYGDKVTDKVKAKMVRNLTTAVVMLEAEMKRSMGTVSAPAPPGHPPAVRTGRLRSSITHEVISDELRAAAGAGKTAPSGEPVEYGLYLEMGTKKMQARPWCRPAFMQLKEQIKKILTS